MDFIVTKMDDGYGGFMYMPTTAGYLLLGLIVVALLLGITFVTGSDTARKISTKQLVFAALAISLAIVTSNIKLARLPFGGSITLFSMLFICLIGHWYGLRIGLMTGIAYGLIQLVIDPYIISIPQLLFDYPLAFGALGLSGLFSGRKHGLVIGYLVGVTGRYFFSFLSGLIFFADFAPETMSPFIYSLGYNLTYILPEAVLTIALLSVPQVAAAMRQTKKLATR